MEFTDNPFHTLGGFWTLEKEKIWVPVWYWSLLYDPLQLKVPRQPFTVIVVDES